MMRPFHCLLLFVLLVPGFFTSAAVAERRLDLLAEVGMVDHYLAEAGCGQPFQVPDDQRSAADAKQRLRRRVGQRPQALTASGSENHRSHQKV